MPMIDSCPTQGAHAQAKGSMGEDAEVAAVRRLLWGDSAKDDVFRRWSQGFRFSLAEPSALLQDEGGPCAAIAPVQAFLLRALLAEAPAQRLPELTPDKCASLLARAAADVLAQSGARELRVAELQPQDEPELSATEFHERLAVRAVEGDAAAYYARNPRVLTDRYGVLLLLYSVILSKGVEQVKAELSDASEPLIHAAYGHGSQGLINLMLTGRAVAHVWDHAQEAGGLQLCGIDRQPEVGFLTVMEHMQYCTVGSFYKNPKNPVWVVASETHLTVLFSLEKKLVSPETAAESARRIFRSFDPDGNNFIQSALLQDLLCATELVSEPEYVDIMRRKLDSENLGIILLNAFMEEFFSGQQRRTPDTFDLLHYNGLPRSNLGGEVSYRRGSAVRLEGELRAACEDPMLTCLQTKWPGLEVSWQGGKSPSLN